MTLSVVVPIQFPDVNIPKVFFQIIPFVATIIALALFSRSSVAPKAIGKSFTKEG